MRLADFIEGGKMSNGYVQSRADRLTQRLGLNALDLPFARLASLRRIDSIWIGGGGGYGLHHDIGTDQFLCQLAGRKRVLAIADRLRNIAALQLEPLFSGRFYRSGIAAALSDRELGPPALASLERYVDTLAPGEVLYLPCAWFHQLRPCEPGISVGRRDIRIDRFVGSVIGSLTRHVAASVASRFGSSRFQQNR